ncbi:MAG: hypothetical protein DCC75_11935 [Proteobacteria bacterium]|nr:MAG: hypothetical protein DCC75_11935 [Pseudomonadota bacterium]
MLKKILKALLCAVLFYVVGAAGGGVLISALSSNTHDRSLEAAMTGLFVIGPISAFAGLIIGFALPKKKGDG